MDDEIIEYLRYQEDFLTSVMGKDKENPAPKKRDQKAASKCRNQEVANQGNLQKRTKFWNKDKFKKSYESYEKKLEIVQKQIEDKHTELKNVQCSETRSFLIQEIQKLKKKKYNLKHRKNNKWVSFQGLEVFGKVYEMLRQFGQSDEQIKKLLSLDAE